VLLGDVVDQLHDHNRLADTGSAEETDLAAAHIGREEVDDLDARLEDLALGLQSIESRRRRVDGAPTLGLELAQSIDGFAEDVEDAAEHFLAHGHHDRRAGVLHLDAADQAVGAAHGHRSHLVATDVLLHLGRQLDVGAFDLGIDLERGHDLRHIPFGELHVDDGTDDLDHFTFRAHTCLLRARFVISALPRHRRFPAARS